MTLAAWLKKSGEYVVYSKDRSLRLLADYAVSTVSGPVVWTVRRKGV